MSTNVIHHADNSAFDWVAELGDRKINAVITDPPYGMDFQSNRATTPEGKKFTTKIEGDKTPEEAIDDFYAAFGIVIPHLADECEVYVWTAWHVLKWWIPAVEKLPGLTLKQMIVWDKGYPGQGDLDGNWGCGHELCLYLKKGRRPIPKRRSAIIAVDRIPAGKNIHPTEKPVPLIEVLVEMSTNPGDLVVDMYSGSGSTSVACQRLGRDSVALEFDEKYIAPSRDRLASLVMDL